jgi:hypothetical protein
MLKRWMMNRRTRRDEAAGGHRRLFTIFCCTAALLASAPSRAGTTCPADPAMQGLHLPLLRAALAAHTQGLIVALGSSSTPIPRSCKRR